MIACGAKEDGYEDERDVVGVVGRGVAASSGDGGNR